MEGKTLAGRGRRRRTLALAAVAVGAIAAAAPLLSTAGAAPPATASSDINDYALFASQSITLKGGNIDGRSVIMGNIGVGTASAWDKAKPYIKKGGNSAKPGDYRLGLCGGQSNKHTNLGPDNYIASPSVDIGPGDCSSIKEAFGYVLRGLPGGAAKPNVCPNALTCVNPPNIAFPALPTKVPVTDRQTNTTKMVSTSGVCNKSVATQQNPTLGVDNKVLKTTLPPNEVYFGNVGKDGKQTFKGNVILQDGTYTFCNVQVDVTAKITTSPGTVINIVRGIQSEGGQFGSDPNTRVNFLWTGDGGLGRRGKPVYYGTYNAPNVDLNLGHSSQIFGRVWARSMSSDTGVNVTAPPPTSNTTTTTSTTTTTIKPTTTSTSTTTVPRPPVTTTTTTIKPTTTTRRSSRRQRPQRSSRPRPPRPFRRVRPPQRSGSDARGLAGGRRCPRQGQFQGWGPARRVADKGESMDRKTLTGRRHRRRTLALAAVAVGAIAAAAPLLSTAGAAPPAASEQRHQRLCAVREPVDQAQGRRQQWSLGDHGQHRRGYRVGVGQGQAVHQEGCTEPRRSATTA